MKDRKVLALILVLVLVMSSFSFAFAQTTNFIKVRDVPSDATTVVVVFSDGYHYPLYKQGSFWNGDDYKEYVSSDIVEILVDGRAVTYRLGTEGGGTINIWVTGYVPTYGTLTITKEVWIDGVKDTTNEDVFTFMVDGETVTASAVNSGQILLETGTYTVTETGYGIYTPDATSQQVTLSTDGATVTFINRYTSPPPPPDTGILTIEKEVWIDGVKDTGNQSVFTFSVDGETVTASAIDSGSIELEVGTYVVTETGYGMFTPDATTLQAIVTTEGGLVTFVNRYTSPPPPPDTGILTIEKEVWIDGVKDTGNQSVFTFSVDSETVTASAIDSGTIELEVGTYVVTETGYGMFTPDATTLQAIVTTQGGLVTFVNRYTSPPPPPDTGILTIEKEVWIDGVKDTGNQSVFTFMVDGETVTASAINSGTIELEVGSYVVTETGYGDYTPDATTLQAIVTTEGGLVTFVNTYTTPVTPTGILNIEKEVWIDGVKDTGNQSVFTFMVDGETVTASAIDSGTIELEVGTYVVTETGYGMFTPDATTLQAIVTTEGGLVTFVNRYTTPPTDGTLIIDKIVTGNLADDTDVFGFSIYPQQVSVMLVGYSVTASAITDGSIQLPEGYYMVVETDYGSYTPATTSQYVWVTAGQTTSVAFYNDWSSEIPTPGSILINKTVTGNRSDDEDVFTFDIEPYYFEFDNGPMPNALQMPEFPLVVTASAVTDGYVGNLEPGLYLVTERDPSPYNITARSSNSEYELDGTRGIIVFVSTDNQTVVNFTNRYNVSTPPSTTYRMSIVKTADSAEVNIGDLITYTITVTNTGDGTLTNVSVVDEMVGLDEVIATLAVGASRTFTATYLAEEVGLLENTATATDDQAPAVQDEALVFVEEGPPLGVPGLTIDKTVVAEPGQVFKPGDTVQFKILVTNTGTEKLENILVEDILAGFLQSIPSLDPGQSQEFMVSVKIDEDYDSALLENIATATNSKVGTLQATEIVIIEEEPPLDIPDTGGSASMLTYGAGAMLSLLGLFKKKRR